MDVAEAALVRGFIHNCIHYLLLLFISNTSLLFTVIKTMINKETSKNNNSIFSELRFFIEPFLVFGVY